MHSQLSPIVGRFLDAIFQGLGCAPSETLTPGEFNRFGPKRVMWCVLFVNLRGGAFGDWRIGTTQYWSSGKSRMQQKPKPAAVHVFRNEAKHRCSKRQDEAARGAAEIYRNAKSAPPDHEYLKRKEIAAEIFRCHAGNNLIVPIHNISGVIRNIQYISTTGKKWFHRGAQVKGCFCVINPGVSGRKQIIICEGIATGCSLTEMELDALVVAAMNAGNLPQVALAVRSRYPKSRIVIAGDNDRFTTGNPGKAKAIEAARMVQGEYAIPEFGDSLGTDFNDLVVRSKAQCN